MNKAELIEALADKTGLQKQEAKKVLDAYIEIVTERMSENEEILYRAFCYPVSCGIGISWLVTKGFFCFLEVEKDA